MSFAKQGGNLFHVLSIKICNETISSFPRITIFDKDTK